MVSAISSGKTISVTSIFLHQSEFGSYFCGANTRGLYMALRGDLHPRRPRGSQSGAGEMAQQKFSRTGGRTPGYQVSPDHFQTALRIPAPDWAEKIPCIILPNQEPIFAKPFGNGPVRLGTQGFFRPFLKTFVAPFRPPPTDCPWVS